MRTEAQSANVVGRKIINIRLNFSNSGVKQLPDNNLLFFLGTKNSPKPRIVTRELECMIFIVIKSILDKLDNYLYCANSCLEVDTHSLHIVVRYKKELFYVFSPIEFNFIQLVSL